MDILVWNPVARMRHELSSMGVRVNGVMLRKQLEVRSQLDWLKLSYHKEIVNSEILLSIVVGRESTRIS